VIPAKETRAIPIASSGSERSARAQQDAHPDGGSDHHEDQRGEADEEVQGMLPRLPRIDRRIRGRA
jgi:hypothetical protein